MAIVRTSFTLNALPALLRLVEQSCPCIKKRKVTSCSSPSDFVSEFLDHHRHLSILKCILGIELLDCLALFAIQGDEGVGIASPHSK